MRVQLITKPSHLVNNPVQLSKVPCLGMGITIRCTLGVIFPIYKKKALP